MLNLYDLTKGNYSILRKVSYPEFPASQIEFDVKVKAESDSRWVTNITINGTYNGPTDVISTKDYQLIWIRDGNTILESGTATLEVSSGKFIRQVWSSTITPEKGFDNFPKAGELINITISPFQIDGNKMSYNWEGTVQEQLKQSSNNISKASS